METNKNENTTTQNIWDSVKAVLRGRFIAIQAYLKTQEKNQINNLTLHEKQLEKEQPQGQQKEKNHKNQGRNKYKRNKGDHSKNQQS